MDDFDFVESVSRADKRKNRKNTVTLAILLVLYIVLLIVQANLSPYAHDWIITGKLSVTSFQGILMSLFILVAVSMVCTCKEGYYLACASILFSVIIVLIRFVFLNDYSVLPGVAVNIANIIIVQIIHKYLVKLSKNEKELYQLAHTDVLTDLPNRRALKKEITAKMELSHIKKKSFAVAIIDLDNFKNINDTIGHDYGDLVLAGISNRWRSVMDESDYMARLGGDEFALVISEISSLGDMDSHINKLLETVNDKFVLKGRDYYVSASIGVSIFPNDSSDASQLMKYADMAMYAAKCQGKNRICYYDKIMNELIENNVHMENIIRHAVENDSFRLVYQPQYQSDNKKLRGFETLIRLSDAAGKQVSPGEFIPVAEKSALIIDIDNWVLDNALREFKPILQKNNSLILSINISASHMLSDSFLDDIKNALEKSDFPAENLELELTESVFVDSLDKAKEVMNKIKEMGIHIALDDFGTGYSSLSYLKELPIDLLKIDKVFVDSIKNGPKEESFVAAIISLSQLMKFAVISEGVEEEYQLKTLQGLGCDYIQGFLWGKPLILDDVKTLIK